MGRIKDGAKVHHVIAGYSGIVNGVTRIKNLFENENDEWEYRVDIGKGVVKIASPDNIELDGVPLALHQIPDVIVGKISLSTEELTTLARHAKENGLLDEACQLASMAYDREPNSPGLCAVYCSILRALKRPERAIEIAESLGHVNYPPLLTSLAAAYCDVGRFPEALQKVNMVIAIARGRGGPEILGVRSRIQKHAPSLIR